MTHLAEIRVPESQNNSKNNGTNFTRGHMGQIKVIRCFAQKFYMVAYVTKAGLGPETEFALLCQSFFRWSRLVIRRHAYLQCLHCLFFRQRSWYCCAGRLASPSITRSARPETLSSHNQTFKVQNLTAGLPGILLPDISHLHPPREIELKNQPYPSRNKKVCFLTILESSKPKIFPTPLKNSQNLRSSRNPCRVAGIQVVSSPLQDRKNPRSKRNSLRIAKRIDRLVTPSGSSKYKIVSSPL